MTVNGAPLENLEGRVLAELLHGQGFDPDRVVVELNRKIVPKSMYDATILRPGDRVEVLQFVGGG